MSQTSNWSSDWSVQRVIRRDPRYESSRLRDQSPCKMSQTIHGNCDQSPRKGCSSRSSPNTSSDRSPYRRRFYKPPHEMPQNVNPNSDVSPHKDRIRQLPHGNLSTFNPKLELSPEKRHSGEASCRVLPMLYCKPEQSPQKGCCGQAPGNTNSDWSPYKCSRGRSQTFNPKLDWSPQKGHSGETPYEVPQTSRSMSGQTKHSLLMKTSYKIEQRSETNPNWLPYGGYWGHPAPKTSETRFDRLLSTGYWDEPPYDTFHTTTPQKMETFPMTFARSICASCGHMIRPVSDFTETYEHNDRATKGSTAKPKCRTLKKCICMVNLTLEKKYGNIHDEQEVIIVDDNDSMVDVIDLVSDDSSGSPTPTTSRNVSPVRTSVQCTSSVQYSTKDGKNTSDKRKGSETEPLASCSFKNVSELNVGIGQLPDDSEQVSRSGSKMKFVECQTLCGDGQKSNQLQTDFFGIHKIFDKCSTSCGIKERTTDMDGGHQNSENISVNGNVHTVNGGMMSCGNTVSHKNEKFSSDVSLICPSAIENAHTTNDQRAIKKKCLNKRKRKHSDESCSVPRKRIDQDKDLSVRNSRKIKHGNIKTHISGNNRETISVSHSARHRHRTKTKDDQQKTPLPKNKRGNASASLSERNRHSTKKDSIKSPLSTNNRETFLKSLPSRLTDKVKEDSSNKNNRNVGCSLRSFFNWVTIRSVGKRGFPYAPTPSHQLPSLPVASGTELEISPVNRTATHKKCKYMYVSPSKKTRTATKFRNKTPNTNLCKYVSKTATSTSLSASSVQMKETKSTRRFSMEGSKLPLLNSPGPISRSSHITKNKEPENLDQMEHIIFLDLDNWGGFFNFLPYPLPERTFVWIFFGAGLKSWNVPTNEIFLRLQKTGCLHFHEQCGSKSNAADFAIAVTIGKMDERLPKTIPFTILSGDRDFTEVERQMKSSYRRIVIIDPHAATNHSNDMLYALLSSVQNV